MYLFNRASIPSARAEECCRLIEGIYGIPCRPIPNFLNLTMTPSNPILHTARLRTIEEMEHNYEGYNYPVKFIMQAGL